MVRISEQQCFNNDVAALSKSALIVLVGKVMFEDEDANCLNAREIVDQVLYDKKSANIDA
jgi:hypothetical protein